MKHSENVVKSVNEKRERMHLEVSLSVAEYLLSGGKVTVLKSKKNPKTRQVRCKEKLVFGTAEPVNRPSNVWDAILTA